MRRLAIVTKAHPSHGYSRGNTRRYVDMSAYVCGITALFSVADRISVVLHSEENVRQYDPTGPHRTRWDSTGRELSLFGRTMRRALSQKGTSF
jgi:hypothetical protein